MDERVKNLWVNALRRGEYKQGHDALHEDGQFCCLGVLCDLHSKETGTKWQGPYYEGCLAHLPPEVMRWAGLEERDPHIGDNDATASMLNDSGAPFTRIANLIETRL